MRCQSVFCLASVVLAVVLPVHAGTKNAEKTTKTAASKGPVTVANTAAAVSSVLAAMAANSPRPSASPSPATLSTTVRGTTRAGHSSLSKPTLKTSATHAGLSTKASGPTKPVTTPKRSTSKKTSGKTSKSTSHKSSNTKAHLVARADITTTAVPSAATSAACASQPDYGNTYLPAAPSAAGFLLDAGIANIALTASAPVGYSWAYAGFYASLQQSGYLFYTPLSSYNQTACAAICDNTASCAGFTIYYERDPILQPAAACPNPSPMAIVRCAFYSTAVSSQTATNIGQWRSSFAVVVAGANGYNKLSAASQTSAGTSLGSATTTRTTSPSASATASNPFTILSAAFADSDVTALARSNFLINGQLVINTTYPGAALPSMDPWSTNTGKSITILYQCNGETRVFAALENTGVYTQQAVAFASATAPGSSLAGPTTPPSGANITIAAVAWGPGQITSPTVYSALYSAYASSSAIAVTDDFFGLDTAWGTIKSCSIWYYTAAGVLKLLSGREYTSIQFSP